MPSRVFRICFHGAHDSGYRVRTRVRRLQPGLPDFVEQHELRAGSSTDVDPDARRSPVRRSGPFCRGDRWRRGLVLRPACLFRAEARLHVAAQPPRVLFPTVETQNAGSGDYVRYQNTQKTLAKSRLVLSAAPSDSKVARYAMVREQEDPIAWLQEELKIEFVAGSEVMEIYLNLD